MSGNYKEKKCPKQHFWSFLVKKSIKKNSYKILLDSKMTPIKTIFYKK